jgi:hypothetical protein
MRLRLLFFTVALGLGCGESADECADVPDEDCGACCDDFEPNGHPCNSVPFGNFTDSPDSDATIPGLSIGSGTGDGMDWYSFRVIDGADLGGNPWITVSVSGPAAPNVTLAGWYNCDDGDDGHTCTVGIPDGSRGDGCRALDPTSGFRLDPECSGTSDEHGTMRVLVTNEGSLVCEDYQLEIDVR